MTNRIHKISQYDIIKSILNYQQILHIMGCQTSKNTGQLSKKQLIVATLNFGSIINNPYEFYCQDFEKELQQISTIFTSLLSEYDQKFDKETFGWKMGKADVKIRHGRYSPLFSIDVGIENSYFVTRELFQKNWDLAFNEEQKKTGQKYVNQERQAVKLFDFIAFHALLIFVYGKSSFNDLIKKNTAIYRQRLRPFFQLSFLDENKKLDTIIQNFRSMNVDVFFIQEYSKELLKFIDESPEYLWTTDDKKDTIIVAKKQSFTEVKKVETVLTKEEINGLNWAGRTSILCLDNIILLNAHLASKAVKNKPQIQQLKTSLISLRENRPNYNIILGGDLNSFLAPYQEFSKHYQMYPQAEQLITTSKKRTMMQAQFKKGEILVQESKDKIITSMKLKNCNILYINQTIPQGNGFLPKNQHPFDHFVVVATVYK